LLGKCKLSQNRQPRDRAGVATGLAARNGEADRGMLDIMMKSDNEMSPR
jgi:predicted FMN-binding regulatory protein PaiB